MIVDIGSNSSCTTSSMITSESTRNIMIIISFKFLVGNKVGWFTSYIGTREHINISKKAV